MRLFSYVVRWDHGFAPNPFYTVCSVATCKPAIRRVANVGDFILGTGSAERDLDGRVIFFMRIGEVITFDQYWADPRFARKIPVMNGSLQQRFGDNIYHREGGKWLQADSRHSKVGKEPNKKNLERDTGSTDRVLLGTDFIYWGGKGPKIPARLGGFVHRSPGHRSSFSEEEILKFVVWISSLGVSGLVADPYEWRYESRWR